LPPYREGWLGRTDADLWPTEMAAMYRTNDESVISSGNPLETVEVYVVDGEKHHVLVNKFPIFDAAGTVIMVGGASVDITEHKLAEELLCTREQRFRSLIENSSDAIALFSPDGGISYASPSTRHIIGYTPEELVSLNAYDLVEPTDREVLSKTIDKVLKHPRVSVEAQARVRHKNGSVRWLEGTFTNLLDEPGIGAIVNNYRDITERKRVEERLREYEKVVEGLEEMILVIDRDYRYLIANRAFLRYRGLPSEQVVGHLVSDLLGERLFAAITKKKLDECFQGRVVKYEMKLTYPTLGERDLFISYFPIDGPDGVDRVACVVQDITERKRAEDKLKQSEGQLLDAQRLAHLGSWNWDLATDTLHWSEELHRIFGVDPQEFKTTYESVLALVHLDDRHLLIEAIENAREKNQPFNFYYRIIQPGGEERIIHSRGHMTNDEQGNPYRMFGAVQDVTERKKAEEALRKYSRQLIEAQESERQNIARELHDEIGQVLTAVRIGLDTVKRSLKAGDALPQLDDNIVIVDQALRRVRDLSLELHPVLLDDLGLTSALRWYTERYTQWTGIRTDLKLLNLETKTRFARELETACFRVVQEALTNVARHAQATHAAIELRRTNESLHLNIVDDGVGFDLSALQKRDAGHVTLGLRSMEERAQALSGTFEIISSPSAGTKINLVLPLLGHSSHAS
jgi:PAS domain S-box-containing protein